jgi:hypothetical protein
LSGATSNAYGYGRYRVADKIALTGYVLAGFDRNSPAYGAGLQVSLLGVW